MKIKCVKADDYFTKRGDKKFVSHLLTAFCHNAILTDCDLVTKLKNVPNSFKQYISLFAQKYNLEEVSLIPLRFNSVKLNSCGYLYVRIVDEGKYEAFLFDDAIAVAKERRDFTFNQIVNTLDLRNFNASYFLYVIDPLKEQNVDKITPLISRTMETFECKIV